MVENRSHIRILTLVKITGVGEMSIFRARPKTQPLMYLDGTLLRRLGG